MIAVNGPAKNAICNSCQKAVKLTPAVWGAQLCSATEGRHFIGNPYKCIPASPHGKTSVCPKCEGNFSNDPSWVGLEFEFECPHCGHKMSTYPTPRWLKAELPTLLQIIGAYRPTEDGRAQPLETDEVATKPVMLSCPNCNAALKVTAASERTVSCEHCGVDVYLPDGLWTRLHPVQTVHPWTVVFEHRLVTAAKLADRKREEANRRADEEMRIRRAAKDAGNQAIASQNPQRDRKLLIAFIVGITVLPIIAMLVLFALLVWE